MAPKTSVPTSVVAVAAALLVYAIAGAWSLLQVSPATSALWVAANVTCIAGLLRAGTWSRFLLYALNGCVLLGLLSYFLLLLLFYPEPAYLWALAVSVIALLPFFYWSGRVVRDYVKPDLGA